VRGKPTPRPRASAPAAVSVTVIVPEVSTVNVRLLCPWGATVLDHVSLFVPDVLLGVVGVLSSPHPTAKSAITNHGDTKARKRNLFFLRVAVPPWFVGVKDAAIMDV
jgi:hypothetical protein